MPDPYAAMRQLHGPDPRPFMRAALEQIAPDVAAQFKAEFEKAMAQWDGTHTILPSAKRLTAEWGVRVVHADGTVFEGRIADDETEARALFAELYDEPQVGVVSRELVVRDVSAWREAGAGGGDERE